jgi:hypothetical protein
MGMAWFYSKFWSAKSMHLNTRKRIMVESRDSSVKFQSKMKQMVTFYQIVSSFPSVLSISFPLAYYQLTYLFNTFNFGAIFKQYELACALKRFDYVSVLLVMTLGPLLATLVLKLVQKIHVHIIFNRYSIAFREIANTYNRITVLNSTYFYMFLCFTYFILPGVTTVLFGMLKPCVDVDSGDVFPGVDLYLEADYSMNCTSERYKRGRIWAAVFTLVYPVGIPFIYYRALYIEKALIKEYAVNTVKELDEIQLLKMEADTMKLSALSFLSQEYLPKVCNTMNATSTLSLTCRGINCL